MSSLSFLSGVGTANADVVTNQDVGVTTAAAPAPVWIGNMALLTSTIMNAGPGTGPVDFTDTVPTGLSIVGAVAGDGTCTTSGQHVTCTITGLTAGNGIPVEIAVATHKAGVYTNTVSVATTAGFTDTNSSNNTASASLRVKLPDCTVPRLSGASLSLARRLLVQVSCKAGKVKRVYSKTVPKGAVVATTPKAGAYVNGTRVGIQISKGKPPKHQKTRGKGH